MDPYTDRYCRDHIGDHILIHILIHIVMHLSQLALGTGGGKPRDVESTSLGRPLSLQALFECALVCVRVCV